MNAIYSTLPDARDFWRDCHSDNSVMTNAWGEGGMGYISMGSQAPTDVYISEEWRYDYIRMALYALDKLSGMSIDPNLKQRLEGEVRFILAYRYFRMTQLFGALPLIKEKPVELEDAGLSRSPRSEVLAYVIENVDKAVAALPPSYTGADRGRITRGAAYMLKANVYLYMASIAKFHEGKQETALWQQAAAAAEEVTKLGYGLEDDYALLFRKESNNITKEIILDKQYVQDKLTHFTPVLASPTGTGITGEDGRAFAQPATWWTRISAQTG